MPTTSYYDIVQYAVPIAYGLALGLGFVLWLLGRPLAKPACIVSGLLLGAAAGFVIGVSFDEGQVVLFAMTIGLSVAGALLAALLFRLWMGLTAAALLALVVPVASLVWTGPPPPDATPPEPEQMLLDLDEQPVVVEATGAEPTDEGEPAVVDDVLRRIAAVYEQQAQEVRDWWSRFAATGQTIMLVLSGLGALAGLLFGLIAPYAAASMQTALVGAVLMVWSTVNLLRMARLETDWMPDSLRAAVLAVGLITPLGILLQWAIFRKTVDK